MKMRDLEARTGVNRETIRVYFRHGLLPEPNRPARNVADYGEEHVRSIMAVRRLQQESRMTLPQIRVALAGGDSATQLGASEFGHLEELVSGRVGVEQGNLALAALARQNPNVEADARVLARLGIVDLVPTDEGPAISLTDAGLLNIWSRMRSVGFDEAHGFPPDILDYYVGAAEYVAGNEARIFLEKVKGRMRPDDAAAMLEFALPAMLDFFGIIRQKAFLRMIGEGTREGETVPMRSLPETTPSKAARRHASGRRAGAAIGPRTGSSRP